MSHVHSVWDSKGETADDKKYEMFTQDGATGGSSTGVLRRVKGSGDGDGDGSEALKTLMKKQQESGVVADGELPAMVFIYKNGFTIGEDGDFHDASLPENEAFLVDLRKGVVPKKLEAEMSERFSESTRSLGVHVVSRESRDYSPPGAAATTAKPKFSAFSGASYSLGSAASASSAVELSAIGAAKLTVDESKECIRVQIILIGGRRVAQKLEADTSVARLYAHVKALSGCTTAFTLLAGFPPATLKDAAVTVKDAGLSGARVTQKSG